MQKPLQIEIIAYAPTAYYHCTHCEVAWREIGVTNKFHQEQVDSSLPPELTQEYQQLSQWVKEIFNRYSDRVVLKVIDAASLEGFVKSLRYGVHHYPAIIVDEKARFTGNAYGAAGEKIELLLSKPVSP